MVKKEEEPRDLPDKEPECEFCGELLVNCTCEIGEHEDDDYL